MDYDLPPLLSDAESDGSLSSGQAAGRERRTQAPALISDSSSDSGDEAWRRGVQPPQAPPVQQQQRARNHAAESALDDIDHSNDEFLDDYFDEMDGGADQLFGPRGLLAGMLQQQEYMQDPINEGLLQQIPVQNLLEALLNSGQAGVLAGGGPFALPGTGLVPSGRIFYGHGQGHLPGVESRVPTGLEGSARRHAISMAEQGFVTAMDPSRHAACAAEGIPGGRRLMSPRGATPGSPPAPRPQQQRQQQRQQQQQPTAAAGAARQAGSLGGLQRADSAVLGGGLQRGDSAASQGMSRVAGQAGGHRSASAAAAGGTGSAALSRLASTARTGAAAGGQHARDGPPELASSGGESDDVPGLASASSDGDYEYGPPPQLRQQQQGTAASGSHASGGAAASHGSTATRSSAGSNAQERDSYAEPPRRRQRRNAVFGQLPGLGGAAAGGTAAAGAAAGGTGAAALSGSGAGQQLWGQPGVPPLLEESDSDSDAEQGPERSRAELAPHVRRQQRQAREQRQHGGSGGTAANASAGSEGSPPGLEPASSADEQQQQQQPPQQQQHGTQLPSGAAAGSRHSSRAGSRGGSSSLGSSDEDSPPPLMHGHSDAITEDAADVGGEVGAWSEGSGIPGLLSDAASSGYTTESEVEPAHGRRQGRQAQAAQAAPAPPLRQQASEDQRAVMHALTSLLPAQQDGAGWAELANYVRHASSAPASRRAGSGGGVQLLSRLVAAAASRFPAEAEAAGLTERPLAPPPSMAQSAAHSAAATAAVSPVGTPAHSVPAAAAAAAATVAAASGAAAAAAAERQRAERRQRAEQLELHAERLEQRAEQLEHRAEQVELQAERLEQIAEQLEQRAQQQGQRAAQQRQRAAQQRQRAEQLAAQQLAAEQAPQPLVTFVAETPAAAAALQQELGPAVRVVADGQEAQAAEEDVGQARRPPPSTPVLLTVVAPGRDLPLDLQLVTPPPGMSLATEDDYDAVFAEQEPHIERQLQYIAAHLQQQQQQQSQQQQPSAAAASGSAAGAGTSAATDGGWDAARIGRAAMASAYTTLLAQQATMRGQQRYVVANTESVLRALAASGAAATQPLPPLVAAAVAAAAPPRPQQAEE